MGGFVVHVYSTGNQIIQTQNNNYYGTVFQGCRGQMEDNSYSDEQVARALTAIVGRGKPIDSKQKWAGAMWLLRWECNYPTRAQEFCERINQLSLPADLEFKCEYNNIRALATLSFMDQDARRMDLVKPSKNDEQVFYMLRGVALALHQELQKTLAKNTSD